MSISKMRFHATDNAKLQNLFFLKSVVVFIVSMSLNGCATFALLGTGAAVGGYVAGRDKPIKQSLTDTQIDSEIKRRMIETLGNVALDISVVTDNGCVLLTGNVPDEGTITKAEDIARTVPGVIAVDNNIVIGKTKLSTTFADAYITSTCRTKLLSAKNIRSLNVKIKTMNHVVYLSGMARNEKERNNIVCIVTKTNGVKKVVSYVTLAGDEK